MVRPILDREVLAALLGAYGVDSPAGAHGVVMDSEDVYVIRTPVANLELSLHDDPDDPLFVVELATYLAARGVPCARPVPRDGDPRTPSAIFTALLVRPAGTPVAVPAEAECAAVGEALARWHEHGHKFARTRDNPRALPWCRRLAGSARLGDDEAALVKEELCFQSLYRLSDLPRGAIHGDARREHFLFDRGRLSGIVGLHSACTDALLLDLAIAVNEWCSGPDGGLDRPRVAALIDAYHAVRPLAPIERGAWPALLRAAALRAWLANAHAGADAGEASKRIFLQRVQHENAARALWPSSRRALGHRHQA